MFGMIKRFREANELQRATQAQLQEEFAAFGVNFMDLHPTIHGGVLREAMALGVATAVEQFETAAAYIGDEQVPADLKAERLLSLYRERALVVDNALRKI